MEVLHHGGDDDVDVVDLSFSVPLICKNHSKHDRIELAIMDICFMTRRRECPEN